MSATLEHHQYGKAETRAVGVVPYTVRNTDAPAAGPALDPSQAGDR